MQDKYEEGSFVIEVNCTYPGRKEIKCGGVLSKEQFEKADQEGKEQLIEFLIPQIVRDLKIQLGMKVD